MRQLDVFVNPARRARRHFPYLVAMQSELARTGQERLMAPAASQGQISFAGRLAPKVMISDAAFWVLLPRMTPVAVADLGKPIANLDQHRTDIVNALDYLFLGI